jgi:hypothetical protein
MELKDLIGAELNEFTVEKFTEVFKVNDDGRKSKSLGFFRDENIAKAFAGNQKDANWHKTSNVLVLTDGKNGFLVGDSIVILDDEQTLLEIREKAMSKLSDAERKVLGI